MFEVGFSELLLIAVLGLIVLGPERLPKVASQIGRWVGRARAMARQFREQLEEESNLEQTTPRRKPASPVATPASAAAPAPAAGVAQSPSELTATGVPGDDDTRHHDYAGAEYTPPEAPPEQPQQTAAADSAHPETADGEQRDLFAAETKDGQRGT